MIQQGGTVVRILVGSAMILAGAALIGMNFGVIEDLPLWQFWPMIFVGIGLLSMTQSRRRHGPPDGYWLVAVGVWMQVSVLGAWGLSWHSSWPLLIIAWGVKVVWESIERKQDAPGGEHTTGSEGAYS